MSVLVPDDPRAVLQPGHQASDILQNSGLIVERQIEMMNVFLGFEQSNKYVITDTNGNHVGYLAEDDGGIGKTIARQAFRTHRAFTAHILDREGKEVLTIRRPFSWINSRIQCIDPATQEVVGEAQQTWHAWRRRYDLFLKRDERFEQFATIDEPFLSWDFTAVDRDNKLVASINRDFKGFAREIFTDTGVYALRLDAVSEETTHAHQPTTGRRETGMTLDERAMLLATAVSVDVDYFSRHSAHRGGVMDMMPLWIPGFGSSEPQKTQAEQQQEGAAPPQDGGVIDPDNAPNSTQQPDEGYFASDESPYEEQPFVDDAQQEPLMGDGDQGSSWWQDLKDWGAGGGEGWGE